ncbi:MAG: TonB-dependent receptor [Prevotellaceae bacterium]|jgi:outer membrane cobalamin receptor|nr:TonB-dependent receptor [Prevotellaceae bacterium]
MKKIILLLIGFLPFCTLPAQQVRGIVWGIAPSGEKTPLAYAAVHWHDTHTAVMTDDNGRFSIPLPATWPATLMASFVGYSSDMRSVTNDTTFVELLLYEGAALNEVQITGRQAGIYNARLTQLKTEVINAAGLQKMACCNIGESFENSASISVGYSDAVSGARQIRLLGLSGIYAQMLEENRSDMRGLATTFGLSFTPGPWLESIQVAKGIGSVLQGYENITGQINLEYRKPTTPEPLFLNLYIDRFGRTEGNAASSLQLSDKLFTTLLAHGSIDPMKTDNNHDGFMDEPVKKQINLANRWLYVADNGSMLRFGVKGLYEKRDGGQLDFDASRPRDTTQYGTGIENTHINAYIKLGVPLIDTITNIAFIADYTFHDLRSFFGLKAFDGTEHTANFNILFQSKFGQHHDYMLGGGIHWDRYRQGLQDVWFPASGQGRQQEYTRMDRDETVGGLFGEYTFSYHDKLWIVAGTRADYHSLFQWLITPRATLKYNITDNLILRASGGRGFRTANVVTDHIGMLATGRQISIDEPLDIEDAWTYGGSVAWYFPLFQDDRASLGFDFFRTQFTNQIIVDQEDDLARIHIYNLNGQSFSNTWQIDFNVAPVERFSVMATFRYTDAQTTYRNNRLRERPLNDRFKAVLNLQYATRMNIWTFDFTAQLNGQSRLPDFAATNGNRYSPVYPLFFAQITRKFRGIDVYIGCENLFNYTQRDPILLASDPYNAGFNSSVIWGPLMERRIYAGLRFILFN